MIFRVLESLASILYENPINCCPLRTVTRNCVPAENDISARAGSATYTMSPLCSPVTRETILNALHEFDAQIRDTPEGQSWISNKAQKFAIDYEGRLYPPKAVVSLATRIPVSDFSGGAETELGLSAFWKSTPYTASSGFWSSAACIFGLISGMVVAQRRLSEQLRANRGALQELMGRISRAISCQQLNIQGLEAINQPFAMSSVSNYSVLGAGSNTTIELQFKCLSDKPGTAFVLNLGALRLTKEGHSKFSIGFNNIKAVKH
jgi:hypothetical protein